MIIESGVQIGAKINLGNFYVAPLVLTAPSPYVTTGLQMFWDMGDTASYPGSGTTITDLSGNGRSGTLSGAPAYSAGGITTTTSKYIYGPTNFNLGSAWTMSIVAKTSTTQPQYWATMWGNESWSSTGYIAYQGANNILTYGTPSGGITWTTTQANIQGNTTAWDFTFTGSTVSLYKNGAATAVSSGAMTSITASSAGIFFGARHVNGGGATPADYSATTFYQIRVYNRALTTTEIATNYSSVKTAYPTLSLP